MYREESIAGHLEVMEQATDGLEYAARAAARRKEQGIALTEVSAGERVFLVCAGCHALDVEKSAPSVREIQRLYEGQPEKVVAWAKKPGRKRTKFAPMPPFGHLPQSDLQAVAEYLLELGQVEAEPVEEKSAEGGELAEDSEPPKDGEPMPPENP